MGSAQSTGRRRGNQPPPWAIVVAWRGGGSGDFRAEPQKVFRRFSARDLLLLSAVCGVIRWTLMGWTTALPWLIVAQILHCGTFTVCHLAAMRYIAARQGSEVIRLQAVYSRGSDGRQHCGNDGLPASSTASAPGRFLGDGAGGLPALVGAAKSGGLGLEHLKICLLLVIAERLVGMKQSGGENW